MNPLASGPLRFRPAARGRRRRNQAISLTPLIDVVFILLVFFMLASNFTQLRMITLHVPGGTQGASMERNAILIAIDQDGLTLDGHTIAQEDLAEALKALLDEWPAIQVDLLPDDSIPLQEVVAVLDAIAGVRGAAPNLLRSQQP